jgi:hypothetical protein
MIIVRERGHISSHVVHKDNEPLEHGVHGIFRKISDFVVLSPIGCKQTGLNLNVSSVSILQLLPNPTGQVSV